jgi:putative colanic acid biosynthesis glycosyltransferase WcaI
MRILIHDFAGHPFQAELSRHLARRNHCVTHVYAGGLPGPKGRLSTVASDPACLTFQGIQLSSQFKKYSAYRRFMTQRQYAGDLKKVIRETEPDIVVSSNTPIDVQAELLWYCRKNRVGFVHWVQDIYCQALGFYLKRRLPLLARPIAAMFEVLEKTVASRSDHSVAIAPEFRNVLRRWNVPESRITLIENWATIEEIPQISRENTWSRSQELGARPVLLYSGTLGMKHRPDLIYLLAERLQQECTVLVITDGIGREYLDRMPPLGNLRTLHFQPYEKLPEVLASADILLATLEADAGQFAVPSKILNYLCAGRPILFAGPRENLSALILQRSGGGLVIDPDDPAAWVDAARRLISDVKLRSEFGNKARSYAELTFDSAKITDRFEKLLFSACKPDTGRTAEVASFSA